MSYHEVRSIGGKKANYIVIARREKEKIMKKSKFIGYGEISKKKIEGFKEKYEAEDITSKKYNYLEKKEIEKIEEFKKKYNDQISHLEREEFEKFEKSFFTELTYNSNAIEGNTLSQEETSLFANEGITPKGKTLRELNEVRNHQRALAFVKNHDGELTEEFILKLHSIILDNISESFAGRYRQTDVRIFGSDIKLHRADKIPQLMKNLIYWYKQNKRVLHQFELAIIFSMKFVTIHPFIDGNGRVSRLLMNFLLSKKDYPWINIYRKQREDYLKAVREANDEKYDKILNLSVRTLEKNLKDFNFL